MLQVKDEVSTFGAGQVAESRRLMRERGDGGRNVGGQLGCRNEAVPIQISAAIEPLKQRPGKDRVSVGPVVGHLLVSAASGEHLAGLAARDFVEVVLRGQSPSS